MGAIFHGARPAVSGSSSAEPASICPAIAVRCLRLHRTQGARVPPPQSAQKAGLVSQTEVAEAMAALGLGTLSPDGFSQATSPSKLNVRP